MTEKLLVTYAEAAEMLSVDERTVRRLAANDDLTVVNLGKRCPRIVVESIRGYVAFLQHPAYIENVGLAVRDPDPGDSTWPDAKTKTAFTRGKIRPIGGQATRTQAAREFRRSTGTENRKEAEALLSKWRLEAHQEQQWDKQPSRTFEELMVEYLKANSEKKSAERDRLSVKNMLPHFRGRELETLRANDINQYAAYRRNQGVTPATINREIATLSAAINYARREWEWGIPNPVTGRKLREPDGRDRWITHEEADRLIQLAGRDARAAQWLPDFIRLALNTGCRKGELLGLDWRRIDFENGLLYLEAVHTKTNRKRSIPLNQEAKATLRSRQQFNNQWCPTSPWVFCNRHGDRIQNVRKSFYTACQRAGIEDFVVHDLRHTCAAWLVTAGVPLAEVRDLLGHTTIKMTERYAHLAPDNVRNAVSKLDRIWSRSGHVDD